MGAHGLKGAPEHYLDERDFLELAAALLREGLDLASISGPEGADGADGASWLADLLEQLAQMPDAALRRVLKPSRRGRPEASASELRRAVIRYALHRNRGLSRDAAIVATSEELHRDARTVERHLAAAEESGRWSLDRWKDGGKK